MKKFIIGLALNVALLGAVFAQQSVPANSIQIPFKSATGSAVDTVVTNATTKIFKLDVMGYYPSFSVTARIRKGTGTPAGKIVLEYSDDDVAYKGLDSLTLANTALQFMVTGIGPWTHRFIRARVVPTGTQSTYINVLGTIKR